MPTIYRASANSVRRRTCVSRLALTGALVLGITPLGGAMAQDTTPAAQTDQGTLLDDIVVTATKQSQAQAAQSVPITISAFSGDQIENLKLTNIGTLAYAIPNVSFESVSSFKGAANFQIRGLGVNSSIASTAPSVGVFVDGIYLGVNMGVLLDTFDLDGIEVLRGPQGTLFGRNVTGGAVLLRSAKPQQELEANVRLRYETGPEYSAAGSITGGLTENLSARLAGLYRYDKGYFNNKTLHDKHFGKDETYVVKPSLRYESDKTDIVLRGEIGRTKGDGPMVTAPDRDPDRVVATDGTVTDGPLPPYGYDYDDVYENFRGSTDLKWHSVTLESTFDFPFGENAALTNVMGYRKLENFSAYASDGTPLTISHNIGVTNQHQWSNELRYNGTFGPATVTIGGFYFHQKLLQLNKQIVINSVQGGRVEEDVFGVFGQVDFALSDQFVVQVGGRYNYEHKKAAIAALASENPNVIQPGTFGIPGACAVNAERQGCDFRFFLKDSWQSFTPKVSLQYRPSDTMQFYATAQKAIRSGGFNVRYNSPGVPPAYDPEKQDAFEVGFKTDLFDRRTRFNGAAFYTKIKKLQRDLTVFDNVTLANRTSTFNTADATTKGFELELVQKLLPGVIFNANVGYVHAKYDKILFDITQDPASVGGPTVDAFDLRQKLPRVSPWTYSLGINASRDFGFGKLTFMGNYNHRDASFFPDYNTDRRDGAVPKLPAADIFDAQLSFEPANTGLTVTLYGKNLTDEFTLNSFTPIAYPALRACACGLNEGRQLGVEVSYKFR